MSLVVLGPIALFRAGLAGLLNSTDFSPVEEASSLEELEQRPEGTPRPEMLLINLLHGREDPGAMMLEIADWSPSTKAVFLDSCFDPRAMSAVMAAGAAGYLLESISREGLYHSLRLVRAGERVLPSELASALAAYPFGPQWPKRSNWRAKPTRAGRR